jgi:hypothetical protein
MASFPPAVSSRPNGGPNEHPMMNNASKARKSMNTANVVTMKQAFRTLGLPTPSVEPNLSGQSIHERFVEGEAPANATSHFTNEHNNSVSRAGSSVSATSSVFNRAWGAVRGSASTVLGKAKGATRKVGRVLGTHAPYITDSNVKTAHAKFERFRNIGTTSIQDRENREYLADLWMRINSTHEIRNHDDYLVELGIIARELSEAIRGNAPDSDILMEYLYYVEFLMAFRGAREPIAPPSSLSLLRKLGKKVGNYGRVVGRSVGLSAPKISDANVSTSDAKFARFAQLESIIAERENNGEVLGFYNGLKVLTQSIQDGAGSKDELCILMAGLTDRTSLGGHANVGDYPNKDILKELKHYASFLDNKYFPESSCAAGAGRAGGGYRRTKGRRRRTQRRRRNYH